MLAPNCIEIFYYWCWLMPIDVDWRLLMLIDTDWCWFMLTDAGWCWLIQFFKCLKIDIRAIVWTILMHIKLWKKSCEFFEFFRALWHTETPDGAPGFRWLNEKLFLANILSRKRAVKGDMVYHTVWWRMKRTENPGILPRHPCINDMFIP